jgi:LemA protein
MSGILLFFVFLLGATLLGMIWTMATYNTLVASKENTKSLALQCLSALKQRVEALAPVADAAQAVLKQDREKVDALLSVRAQALAAIAGLESAPDKPEAFQQTIAAEQLLNAAWPRLTAQLEKLPAWTGNARAMQLFADFSQTEPLFHSSRDAYNGAAASYNALRREFPAFVIAGVLGLSEAPLFELSAAPQPTVATTTPPRFSASA